MHENQIVFSKLNMDALWAVAAAGGGQAVPVGGFKSLLDRLDELEKRKLEGESRTRYQPRYQLFLAAGLGALALQTMIPARPRKRVDRLERSTAQT